MIIIKTTNGDHTKLMDRMEGVKGRETLKVPNNIHYIGIIFGTFK